jgi:hypothetical protein
VRLRCHQRARLVAKCAEVIGSLVQKVLFFKTYIIQYLFLFILINQFEIYTDLQEGITAQGVFAGLVAMSEKDLGTFYFFLLVISYILIFIYLLFIIYN